MYETIRRQAFDVFHPDLEAVPPMTLRGGDAVDSYDNPPPYDPAIDAPTDAYLVQYSYWGITFLDAASWRHYLPRLIDYALRHFQNQTLDNMIIDGLLKSLRPPDQESSRLRSLSAAQEVVIVAFLDVLAFDEHSAYQDCAMQVLEEHWLPNALYRERPPESNEDDTSGQTSYQ